ncbi:hypothetical protein [Coleofasciculus sp. H7-2]
MLRGAGAKEHAHRERRSHSPSQKASSACAIFGTHSPPDKLHLYKTVK